MEIESGRPERRANKIAELNDRFRRAVPYPSDVPGRVLVTQGVHALPDTRKAAIFESIREHSSFAEGNDPYEEHDFGVVDVCDDRYIWKIDYYDKNLQYGSADPSDCLETIRVMTVMHVSEY